MSSITFIPPFNFLANSTATCLPGDVVLSGGYRANVINPQFGAIIHESTVKTEPTSTEDGWTVEIQGQSLFTVVSIAECFNNP